MAALVDPDELVYLGGPVQPQAVVVLADFAEPERAGALVLETSASSPGARRRPPTLGELHAVRVFAGYAGWGPGQLEDELDEGSWLVFPARAADVFTSAPTSSGREVLRRDGGKYAAPRAPPGRSARQLDAM